MNRFAFALIASVVLMNTASAREVAFCTPGFNIQVVAGDKAVCTKTATVVDDVGPRKCQGDGRRLSDGDLNDGGDMCKGSGFGGLPGPARDCKLDYGLDARNNLVQGGPDRCVKTVRRTVAGDIATRQE
jgi:hypothetical protein